MQFEQADEDLPVNAMFRAAGLRMPDDIEMRNSFAMSGDPAGGRLDRLART